MKYLRTLKNFLLHIDRHIKIKKFDKHIIPIDIRINLCHVQRNMITYTCDLLKRKKHEHYVIYNNYIRNNYYPKNILIPKKHTEEFILCTKNTKLPGNLFDVTLVKILNMFKKRSCRFF